MLALLLAALWYRGEAATAKKGLAEFKGAYALLAAKVQEQNAAVDELERASKEAAARAAQERARAVQTVRIAQGKAATLERALSAPREASECPAGKAVVIVRADLAAR